MFNVLLGQNWDIAWHNGINERPTEKQYLQMVRHKTAVLPRLNVRMIAALMGLKKRETARMISYVEAIGSAFQIQDDIIAVTSEAYKEERDPAEDIREGKRSLMVVKALSKKNKKAELLTYLLNRHTGDANEVSKALKIICEKSNISFAEKKSKKLVEKAWKDLSKVVKEGESKDNLEKLSKFLIERKL